VSLFLLFQGMTESFIYDFETDHPRQTSPEETSQILDEIHQEFKNEEIQVNS
jgi:hypothetical protein